MFSTGACSDQPLIRLLDTNCLDHQLILFLKRRKDLTGTAGS